MKKFISMLMVITIIVVGYNVYLWGTRSTDDKLAETQAEAQKIIDETKKKEQEEKMRKLEIQALQNPDIVNEAMTKVGKLIVFESGVTYTDVIRETSFWGAKETTFDLKYNYGISYDFTKVKVDKFVEKTVYIKLSKNDLKIGYIEENNENSKIDGDATWFESEYSAEDINLARDNAKVKVREFIEGYQDAYIESMKSLKEQLKGFILKLGYDNVIFVEA